MSLSLSLLGLFSGVFALGAISLLFLQKRTLILLEFLLFLTSLFLIQLGLVFTQLSVFTPLVWEAWMPELSFYFQLLGVVSNVLITPFFTRDLLSLAFTPRIRILLFFWNLFLVLCMVGYLLMPRWGVLMLIGNIQLILTIGLVVVFSILNLKRIPRMDIRKMVKTFLIFSAVFLVLLVMDYLITNLPIEFLKPVDNISLSLFLIGLNLGGYAFANRIFLENTLTKSSKLTPHCIGNYQLSPREVDIIENLLEGKSNAKLAEDLYISKKTVENHLYNIYQKMGLRNRMELIQTLKAWGELP